MLVKEAVELRFGYDSERRAPYFCDSPKSMKCESRSFEAFPYAVQRKLAEPDNAYTRFFTPPVSLTGLEPVEFRSIRTIVAIHNGAVRTKFPELTTPDGLLE